MKCFPRQLPFLLLSASLLWLVGCPRLAKKSPPRKIQPAFQEPRTMDDLNHPGWYDRTTRRVLKRGVQTKTAIVRGCLKKFSTTVEHADCVYRPWLKGSQTLRISILHELVSAGVRGQATLLVLFRKENVPFRTALSDHVLAYVAHLDALPLDALARFYRDSRDTFRAALNAVGVKTRVLAAQKLVVALGLTTPALISKELSGYLRFSSVWLWKQIRLEKELGKVLVLTSLSTCGQGLPPYTKAYREGVIALYRYYLRWLEWKKAVSASGVGSYRRIIKILGNQLTVSQLRGINGREFRRAMRLTRELQTLYKKTEQFLLFVSERKERTKLLSWLQYLRKKSPIVTQGN